MKVRPTADNVILRLLPREASTSSGIALVYIKGPSAKEYRKAEVLAVGPGHYDGCKHCGGTRGTFIPTTVRPGDVVLVDALCGQNWAGWDISVPRHNPNPELDAIEGERGEFRVVRESECLAILEADAQAAE